MGALDYLKELEGRVLDATSFKMLERNYEMLEENNRLLTDKASLLEGKVRDLEIRLKTLQQENMEQKSRAGGDSNLAIRDGLYYRGDDGPFCTGCYDSQSDVIRLSEQNGMFNDLGKYKCPKCGEFYK